MKSWCCAGAEGGAPLAFAVWVDFTSGGLPTFNYTGKVTIKQHGGQHSMVETSLTIADTLTFILESGIA